MQVCLIGTLIVLMVQPATAQVDSSSTTIKKDTFIRICSPSRKDLLNPPLIVIKSHNQTFCFIDTGGATKLQAINPQWVKKIDILKDRLITAKDYGEAGKNGVVEITLDDEKYPDAYQSLLKIRPKK